MKKIIAAFILFVAIQHLSEAQKTSAAKRQSVTPKKSITAKDLNTLETKSIKAIIANEKQVTDTVSPRDSLVVKSTQIIISEEIKEDTVKAEIKLLIDTISADKNPVPDSIVRKAEPVNILEDSLPEIPGNKITPKVKISREDSLLNESYSKNSKMADSIRSANKHWLDSTLTALPSKKPVVINAEDEIEIYITGGGLYTGVNPNIYDRLTVYNSGLVHRELKTKLQGEKTEDKKISKDALRKLAQYIIDMGFFDFNYLYDCDSKDKECITRLKMKPEPTPLSITITVGARRKKIYVALYAPHMESNWVNYPANLEKIVNAIYDVVGR